MNIEYSLYNYCLQCYYFFINFLFSEQDGKYDEALAIAKLQVENGAQVLDINMDEGTKLELGPNILVILSNTTFFTKLWEHTIFC